MRSSRKLSVWRAVGTVRHQTTLTMLGCECNDFAVIPIIPINVTLSWSAKSPHEVLLTFMTRRRRAVEWRTALDLLIDGLYGPAGLGDISILPCLDDPCRVELILESPSHPHAVGFTARRQALWEFVAAMQAADSAPVSGAVEP